MPWSNWRTFFENRATRPTPASIEAPPLLDHQRAELMRSLRIFQAGETGEGRIVHEISRFQCLDIDDDYRASLRLMIAEEGRHARMLGLSVRALGGEPIRHTWAQRGFAFARRAAGMRLKLMVLFAAEVIGIVFYGALAKALPASDLQRRLEEIADDETAHYHFHTQLFRQYEQSWIKRQLFRGIWACVMSGCVAVVLLDHRRTLKAFGIAPATLIARSMELSVIGSGAAKITCGAPRFA